MDGLSLEPGARQCAGRRKFLLGSNSTIRQPAELFFTSAKLRFGAWRIDEEYFDRGKIQTHIDKNGRNSGFKIRKMESEMPLIVGDIVDVSWKHGLCFFAIIAELRLKTAIAHPVPVMEIGTIAVGSKMNLKIVLRRDGSAHFPKATKEAMGCDGWGVATWQKWQGDVVRC